MFVMDSIKMAQSLPKYIRSFLPTFFIKKLESNTLGTATEESGARSQVAMPTSSVSCPHRVPAQGAACLWFPLQ